MKKQLFILCLLIMSCKEDVVNSKISGQIFGTTYSTIYNDDVDYKTQFDSLFTIINASMSTYIPNSTISKINRNEDIVVDEHFKTVLNASKQVYRLTEGAFDPTIGGVVNAWDFGPEGKIENLDSLKIKQLMSNVGLNRVGLVDNKLKKHPDIKIDFNAIAKGYGVDVIANFLESKAIENYLVEIGGEIRVKGINKEKNKPWKVGIE